MARQGLKGRLKISEVSHLSSSTRIYSPKTVVRKTVRLTSSDEQSHGLDIPFSVF